MGLRKDSWRSAIVRAPFAEIAARGSIAGLPRVWLPDDGRLRFLADPFGLWRGDRLHVFVEALDYRDRIGRIDCLTYDADLTLLARATVLREPWHLSYPFVFEADGETWMLPEAFRSGRLTLYRAVAFPDRWEAAATIDPGCVPIDATPFRHDGLWWLFHAAGEPAAERQTTLHLAFAERLTGPWRRHPSSPVRHDAGSARPGGTAMMVDGRIALPVQDCAATYGGAIRMLWIDTLNPDRFAATAGAPIAAPDDAAPYTRGLHTMAAAGAVTLVDMKRRVVSPHAMALDIWRRARGIRR